ncbi:hypothetical protein M2390_001687 [Mycetocola sp. BIGb0189]|nr:hypothetical protein [Mycetocola sp. BIGb0189]MCS4276505.1 hypothetical protein [Mycetocola sp. BIGb0189]
MQQLVLDAGQPGEGFIEYEGTLVCECNDVTTSVRIVAASEDEAALFHFVKEPHDVAGIQAEYARDVLLRQVSALLQERERKELPVRDVSGLRRCIQGSPASSRQIADKGECATVIQPFHIINVSQIICDPQTI